MGTVKAIVGILVIIAAVYSVFQIAPVEMNNYSFQDDLRQIAITGASSPNKTDDDLRVMVLNKAKEHDLPLLPAGITVQRIGTPGAPAVYVGADYSVPIDLPGYSFALHFTPSSGNKGF